MAEDDRIAPLAGVHFITTQRHKFSANFEVRDKNMRKTLAITWRPFKHEVPSNGSVWVLVYDSEQDKFIPYDK